MHKPEKIDVGKILADIRAGMGDVPIMERYQLSPRLYGRILDRLRQTGVISSDHLAGRMSVGDTTSDDLEKRSHKRNYVLYPIAVYDANNPVNNGALNDITQTGFQVQGMNVEVDEIGTYMIRSDALAVHSPFTLDAICRWVQMDQETNQLIAGFEISAIPQEGQEELSRLIELVSVTE
jgi:hypothetical protein